MNSNVHIFIVFIMNSVIVILYLVDVSLHVIYSSVLPSTTLIIIFDYDFVSSSRLIYDHIHILFNFFAIKITKYKEAGPRA